jgi:hypothetical protein
LLGIFLAAYEIGANPLIATFFTLCVGASISLAWLPIISQPLENVGSIKCNGNGLANRSFKDQQIVCISAGKLLGGACLVWSDNPLPLLGGRSWFFLSLVGSFLVPSHLAVVSGERVAKRPGRIVGLWRKGGVVVCSLAC